MDKLYTCFKCKGAVIERNGTEFCSECGEVFKSNHSIVSIKEPEPEVIEATHVEVLGPEDEEPEDENVRLVEDMIDIIKQDEEERLEKRRQLKGIHRVESDVEGAGKLIFKLLTDDY